MNKMHENPLPSANSWTYQFICLFSSYLHNNNNRGGSIVTVAFIVLVTVTVMAICHYHNVSYPVEQAMKVTVKICFPGFLLWYEMVTKMSHRPSQTKGSGFINIFSISLFTSMTDQPKKALFYWYFRYISRSYTCPSLFQCKFKNQT